MPTSSLGVCDLRELAHLLRKERLFLNAEQENAEQLNAQVSSLTNALAQQAWIAAQQRRNLQLLVLARQDCLPALQIHRGYSSDNLKFVDAGPVVGYAETVAYGEFLAALRNAPELLAGCLVSGDKTHSDRVSSVVHTITAGLYGSCLLAADKRLVLRLLRQLALLQLAPSDNPRRLLRHGTCAFSRLYSTFHTNLHTAQLFLTAALHGPIMALLAEDERFLDVDPEKAALRCGSGEAPDEHAQLRELTVCRLVYLTELFITGLSDHIFCFPPNISWLLRQLVSLLSKSGFIHEKEIYEICTDLLLTHFICPAIVNPEPHGIIEAPVSRVARFNLMQVAQILQNLAMNKYDERDGKVQDLYSKFNPDCVSRIISSIMDGGSDSAEVPLGDDGDLEGVSRAITLLTLSQLNALVSFLQSVLASDDDLVDRQRLEMLLTNLPPLTTNGHKDSAKTKPVEGAAKRPSLLSKAVRQKSQSNGDINEETVDEAVEPVLMIRLPGEQEVTEILSETKVLESEVQRDVAPARCSVDGQDLPDSAETSQSQEKRTRFSLSHDEGSIGNTSDNLEAISEAASNHSGASSLESEGEDQNDNLSDMVSANVSGRGSPNISGRDTPSSQVTEGEAADRPAPVPHPVPKQSRSDIEDKFGKFEIKKQEILGDETVSLVSDTWSTDVLASDSELVVDVDRFPRPPNDGPPHPFIQHSLDISETASEAWSTDVMASDSERMIEVDTDDTASVARSDDTAASESGGRGDDPGTPPPATFRPISRLPRTDEPEVPRVSLAVPPSPTRGSDPTHGNVTGRGGAKADYKRRTLEFVGAISKPPDTLATLESPKMIHVIDKMDGGGRGRSAGRPPLRSPHTPTPIDGGAVIEPVASLAGHNDDSISAQNDDTLVDDATPPASFSGSYKISSSNFVVPPKFPDAKVKSENDEVDRVFRSSTSLASSSSGSSNAASATPQPTESKLTSTGAIPKSISFDKTADKDFLDDKNKKKSFFGNLKMSFKNRKIKKTDGNESGDCGGVPRVRRVLSEDSKMHNGGSIEVEDILAKYRGKTVEDSEIRVKTAAREVEEGPSGLSEEGIFLNAKRKLRIVFSRADLQSWPAAAVREKELVSFLHLQLAEARSLQNRDLVSQLHETLRCVKLFDADGCRRLVAALRNDLVARSRYSAYLTRVRQMLLSRAAHLTRLTHRLRVETRLTEDFLIALCVRLFLERREDRFRRFNKEFRALSVGDEKTDLLDSFLEEMAAEMDRDNAWHGASEDQRSKAHCAIETAVLSRVYSFAFYPNGDGDVARDQLLHDHIKKLASIITPNHKDLQIPVRYHGECPWPSAQAEVAAIASYKTPKDKVQCVMRCAATIMNLLALASEGSVAAADEFLPVLVYVVIAANPPGLLSTVQYVDNFHRNLSGAGLYYWTQFCSAIELIKNMDYNI